MSQYHFSNAIAGFFELPTVAARRVLPQRFEPVEQHPGSSIFSLTVFEFHSSEVGPYQEAVMSIHVAPLLRKDQPFPKAALYPFQVATSTAVSRQHGIDRWRLPHFPEDIRVEWASGTGSLRASIIVGGGVAAELTVFDHRRAATSDLYQVFMEDTTGRYLSQVRMDGSLAEHEDERGRLELADCPFNRMLPLAQVAEIPLREQWMISGTETFSPLTPL